MKKISIMIMAMLAFVLSACQDNDIERRDMILSGISADQITGALQGDDYVLTWGSLPSGQSMQIAIYRNGTLNASEVVSGTSYTHKMVATNVPFEYVFKVTDGENFSRGVIKTYLREGATSISGLQMSQVEKVGGYDAKIEWNKADDATNILLVATTGTRTVNETLSGSATEYVISNVVDGEEWNVTVTAQNDKGKSLPTTASLRIGKTAIGFLSEYATPDELIANGDDDEASAWLWLHEEYPTAQYLYFGNIKSGADLEQFRVLFWMRDLEGVGEDAVWNMSETVMAATPSIQSWYKDGGSLLLWSHATPYIGTLGRLDTNMLKANDHAFGTGEGGFNGDTWKMAVQLNPGGAFSRDFSTHPIYKGIETESIDRTKLIPMKGAGWTEDHNCLYFNIPAALTGFGPQDEACYNALTSIFGIYPLGTWDSQIDWVSQLNIWEAQQGNTEFKGTILCIGNGGCEFSLKNADGTPDKSAHPKNNAYQDNVLKLAKNSLEYLKTR
ncbi:MAG: DUF4960 domain-containing protein [Prevotella sp.]|nr:DUF4960 domain-containing protein [Prevotella sp.]